MRTARESSVPRGDTDEPSNVEQELSTISSPIVANVPVSRPRQCQRPQAATEHVGADDSWFRCPLDPPETVNKFGQKNPYSPRLSDI